ncbi:MAG: sulfatase-like hydrolase/transferase, partial [Verrucomicrobiales bacterium]|nr:sulfatase-like hydrolase/transferase [Verrucomicrobiales bacterium]
GPRPGFDYSASFIGQGRYFDCPFEINGQTKPTKGWVDDVATDFALQFMRENRERPFLLTLGFKAPHGPRGPEHLPERLRNLYAGETIRPVPNLTVPAIYRSGNGAEPNSGAAEGASGRAVTRPGHLDYLRQLTGLDENLGRLLKALDELALATNTVVIYTSDNGFFLGEHGLGDKRALYEESIRIPMLVRYPKLAAGGTVRVELVLNLDLAPTVLELAGLAIPSEMQGRSWAPLLRGRRVPWRSSFLAQYFFERNNRGTPMTVGVRTTTAKLITYPGHEEWTELFDLVNDPYETRNLARDPAHKELLHQLRAELEAQMKATDYRVPEYAHRPDDAPSSGTRPEKKRKQVALDSE